MAKPPAAAPAQNQGEARLREAERARQEQAEAARQAFEEQDAADPKTGVDSSYDEPPTDPDNPILNPAGDFYDSAENPRGIPDYLTDGAPDSQATDAQK